MQQSLLKYLRAYSASHEILRNLWNQKVHYSVHKSPLPVTILSPMNPIHIPTHSFPEIHTNVVLPSTPRSSKWSPPFRPPNQNVVCTPQTRARHMSRPSHYPCFDHPTTTRRRLQTMQLLIMQLFLQPPFTSSLLGPNIFLSTLFSNTINFPTK
jgi:hypothetical protein